MSAEWCLKQQTLNPTRTITRFRMHDRIIHTDYNCLCSGWYQSTIKSGMQYTTAVFRVKKYL